MGAIRNGKQEREISMKNCYPLQRGNHLISRAFLFTAALCVLMLMLSFGVSAYELNGTSTGNLLNGGRGAEADGFSVYADTENGGALTLEQGGKTSVLDADNAQFINVCGEKVCYISINGADKKTELRLCDLNSGKVSVLWETPMEEGMKNLMILDGKALLISDGKAMSFDLDTKKAEVLWGEDLREFVVVNGGAVYTVNGESALYFRAENGDVKTLASDVLSFDCFEDTVYYSNGTDGIFAVSLSGGESQRLAEGGTNLVYSDDLYWQNGGTVYSLNGGKEAESENAEGAVFSVLGSEVTVTEDAYATLASADEGLSPSAVTTSSLPAGEYKSWKQQDPRWGGNSLGNSTISSIGCTSVAVSILLVGSGAEKDRYLAGKFDPGVFVKEMTANGGFTSGGGMYWSVIGEVYPSFSVYRDTGKTTSSSFYNFSKNEQAVAIKNHLAAGRYVILCVNNSRSGNTHWLAVDYATNNEIYICDPGYSSVASPSDVFGISWYPKVTRAIIFNYSGVHWDGGDPVVPPSNNWDNPFSDVKSSDWFYDDIAEIHDAGLMVGISTTKFSPNTNMTRKEFVAVMGRLVETDFDEYEYEFDDVSLHDPNQAWYAKYACWAARNNIMVGDGKNFNPDDQITREQICSILIRLSKYLGFGMVQMESAVTFADASKISSWAKEDMKAAQIYGLIYGVPSGSKVYAQPQYSATRAQVAAMVIRFTRQMPID